MQGLAGADLWQQRSLKESSVLAHDMRLGVVSVSVAWVAADDVTIRGVQEVIDTRPLDAVLVGDPRDCLQADCVDFVPGNAAHDRANVQFAEKRRYVTEVVDKEREQVHRRTVGPH